jgi:hypothetical protein
MRVEMQDRLQRPVPGGPERKSGDEGGPSRPDVKRPENNRLLERMKRVDPDQARRYRQRSGE